MIVYDLKELIGKIDEDGILVQEVVYSLGTVSRRYGHYDSFRHNDNAWLIEYRTGEDMIKAPKEDDEDWLIETVVDHIDRGESKDLFESWEFRVLKVILADNFDGIDIEEYFGDEARDYSFITDYYNNEGKRFVFLEYDYGYLENTFLVDEDDDLDDEDDDLDDELKLREDIYDDLYDFKNGRNRKNGTFEQNLYKYENFPTLLFYTEDEFDSIWEDEIYDFYNNNYDYEEDENGEDVKVYYSDKYATLDEFINNESDLYEELRDEYYEIFKSKNCLLNDEEYNELVEIFNEINDKISSVKCAVNDISNGLYNPHQIVINPLLVKKSIFSMELGEVTRLIKELIIDKYPNMVRKKNVRESVLSDKVKELIKSRKVKSKIALESILKEDTNKLSSEEEKYSTSEISSLEIENNEEVRTPETPFENGVAGLLNQAIVDEWTTIDEYNSILATISQNEEEVPEGLVAIIQDIIAEEYIHIGQLESLLQTISPNVIQIENGKLEAEEELDTDEELIFKDDVKRG